MISPCPQSIIDELQKPKSWHRKPRPSFRPGSRNQAVASFAGLLKYHGASPKAIAAEVMSVNDNSEAPLGEDEALSTIESISRYPQNNNFTEVAVSSGFAEAYQGHVAMAPAYGWLTHDGIRWKPDSDGLNVQELVKEFCVNLAATVTIASDELSSDQSKAAKKSVRALQTRPKISNIAKLAMSDPRIKVSNEDFDRNSNLFNCENGTLDLQGQHFKKHDPSDLITKVAKVSFDPNAESPVFDKFLNDILSEEHQSFFMRLMGMTLLGNPTEQVFVIVHGSGKNGKTTLTNICMSILGEYAVTVEPSTLLMHKNQGIRNDLARLVGKRMAATTETPQGGILDAAIVKRISGNDTIAARHLYKEHFEFQPKFVTYMITNHLPVINGADIALARRLITLKFQNTIPEAKTDPQLGLKLEQERSGVFNRILKGLKDYQKNGLKVPPDILAATEAYVLQSNIMQDFCDECLALEPKNKLRASELSQHYRFWMSCNGYKPLSNSQFRSEFERTIDIEQMRDAKGKFWPGLVLKS